VQSGSCSPSCTTSIIQAGALPAQPGSAAAFFAHASATHQAAPGPASRGLSLEQHPTDHAIAKLEALPLADTVSSDKHAAKQATGHHKVLGMTASPAAGGDELAAHDYNQLLPQHMLTSEGIRCVGLPAAKRSSLGPMNEKAAAAMESTINNSSSIQQKGTGACLPAALPAHCFYPAFCIGCTRAANVQVLDLLFC